MWLIEVGGVLFLASMIVDASLAVSIICIIIIVVSLAVILLKKKKTVEEKKAAHILKSLSLLKEGKAVAASPAKKSAGIKQASVPPQKFVIKKEETSLKQMLVKKFKPKIESQLGTEVKVLDFNAKEENFLVLADISGVKILLTLDSSGKIVDYKKVKREN